MSIIKPTDLDNLNDPKSGDLLIVIDIDGGIGGKAKVKKLSVAHLLTLITNSSSGLISNGYTLVSGDYFGISEYWFTSLAIGKLISLLKVSINVPAWVRFYDNEQDRLDDLNRQNDVDSTVRGLVFEGIFDTDLLAIPLNPVSAMYLEEGYLYVTVNPYNTTQQQINLTILATTITV